jgi:hypothetical protein
LLRCIIGAKPEFTHRRRRDGDRLVGGQHSQSAALQVSANQAGDELDCGPVERHVGFIEYPQGTLFMHQASERRAPLLPLRQIAASEILAAVQSDQFKRIERGFLVE